MKCTACGYYYNDKNPNEYEIETKLGHGGTMKIVYKNKNGGKPFIEICGLSGEVRRSGSLIIRNTTPLYACPNCGTVRMDI